MTRQKKEIIRRINEIEEFIEVDEALSFGCAPADAYDTMFEEIFKLEKELAILRHYNSIEEMYYDDRILARFKTEPLPFD